MPHYLPRYARVAGLSALVPSRPSIAPPRNRVMPRPRVAPWPYGVRKNFLLRWPSVAVRSDTMFVAANILEGDSVTARPAYLGRVYLSAKGELLLSLRSSCHVAIFNSHTHESSRTAAHCISSGPSLRRLFGRQWPGMSPIHGRVSGMRPSSAASGPRALRWPRRTLGALSARFSWSSAASRTSALCRWPRVLPMAQSQ